MGTQHEFVNKENESGILHLTNEVSSARVKLIQETFCKKPKLNVTVKKKPVSFYKEHVKDVSKFLEKYAEMYEIHNFKCKVDSEEIINDYAAENAKVKEFLQGNNEGVIYENQAETLMRLANAILGRLGKRGYYLGAIPQIGKTGVQNACQWLPFILQQNTKKQYQILTFVPPKYSIYNQTLDEHTRFYNLYKPIKFLLNNEYISLQTFLNNRWDNHQPGMHIKMRHDSCLPEIERMKKELDRKKIHPLLLVDESDWGDGCSLEEGESNEK